MLEGGPQRDTDKEHLGPDGGTGRRARLKMKPKGVAQVVDDLGNPLVIPVHGAL